MSSALVRNGENRANPVFWGKRDHVEEKENCLQESQAGGS